MAYNEKAVNAIEPFNRKRGALTIQFQDQRMVNGITNALTMLIEEKGWNIIIFQHLCSALTAQVESLIPRNEDLESTLSICLMEIQKYK